MVTRDLLISVDAAIVHGVSRVLGSVAVGGQCEAPSDVL